MVPLQCCNQSAMICHRLLPTHLTTNLHRSRFRKLWLGAAFLLALFLPSWTGSLSAEPTDVMNTTTPQSNSFQWMSLTFQPGQPVPEPEGLALNLNEWEKLEAVSGPMQGRGGVVSDSEQTLQVGLERPISSQGTLVVWFQTDAPLHAGPEVEAFVQQLVRLQGVSTLDLSARPSGTTLRWEWDIDLIADPDDPQAYQRRPSAIRAFDALPGLPGPGWYQLIYTWDAEAGIFRRYLNGTPMSFGGAGMEPWEVEETAKQLNLTVGRFALGDLRISDQVLPEKGHQALTPPLYRYSTAALLGQRPADPFDGAPGEKELIYENPLASPSDIEGWVMEGPAQIAFKDGWMRMWTPDEDFESTFWCDKDFPSDMVVQWEMRPVPKERSLAILYFSAIGKNGEDIFDPELAERAGEFHLYHSGDIDNYHISFWSGNRPTSNLRKNRGFYLVQNGPQGIPVDSDQVHKVTLVKQGGAIQLAVDDRLVIDYVDDGESFGPVHGEGKIGFRQVRWTDAFYRNLRVYKLPSKD